MQITQQIWSCVEWTPFQWTRDTHLTWHCHVLGLQSRCKGTGVESRLSCVVFFPRLYQRCLISTLHNTVMVGMWTKINCDQNHIIEWKSRYLKLNNTILRLCQGSVCEAVETRLKVSLQRELYYPVNCSPHDSLSVAELSCTLHILDFVIAFRMLKQTFIIRNLCECTKILSARLAVSPPPSPSSLSGPQPGPPQSYHRLLLSWVVDNKYVAICGINCCKFVINISVVAFHIGMSA